MGRLDELDLSLKLSRAEQAERLQAAQIMVKLFLHISAKEQLKRFKAREKDPLKCWKITEEDWRNRQRRSQCKRATEDMLARTDTEWAPWHPVEGESKRHAPRRPPS